MDKPWDVFRKQLVSLYHKITSQEPRPVEALYARSSDTLSHQESPPPPIHRVTGVVSTSSHDGRRPPRPNVEPVLSQDGPRPSPWTNQIQVPANSSDDRQYLESTLRNMLHDDFRYLVGHCPIVITNTTFHKFRILSLGEVCNSCLTISK